VRPQVLAGVWLYTILALVTEVYAAENIPNVFTATTVVIIFALSQAAGIVLFYMDLKDEPGSVIVMIIIPIMFLAGLLISVVASLG